MLGLGSFQGITTSFQMHQVDPSVHVGPCQRSVSPWNGLHPAEYNCQNYQLPANTSSDQFTPQDYPTVTKLPPRQLHWVTSSTRGYDMAPAALNYDVDTVSSTVHHLAQPYQIVTTTTNTNWSSQFSQVSIQNQATSATNCSASDLLPQSFQDLTKNYFVDCLSEQITGVHEMQPVCGREQFTTRNSAFITSQPPLSDCCPPAINLYSGGISGVKSDPDGPTDWQCTLPGIVWRQTPDCFKSSPGQQTDCTSTMSPLSYHNAQPYTPTPARVSPWSNSCEQKTTVQPMKITPSMSIGESAILSPMIYFFVCMYACLNVCMSVRL